MDMEMEVVQGWVEIDMKSAWMYGDGCNFCRLQFSSVKMVEK